jgi:hypothetical protein
MSVQVHVTWTLVGDDEFTLTSSFGQIEPADDGVEVDITGPDITGPVERVLDAESSSLAPGLAVQVA